MLPAARLRSGPQFTELPEQNSAASQPPLAGRQTTFVPLSALAGQFRPLHVSAASQTPVEGRQMVPAGIVKCRQTPLLHWSSVHGLPSLVHDEPVSAPPLTHWQSPS
jgi:hypothetical protein